MAYLSKKRTNHEGCEVHPAAAGPTRTRAARGLREEGELLRRPAHEFLRVFDASWFNMFSIVVCFRSRQINIRTAEMWRTRDGLQNPAPPSAIRPTQRQGSFAPAMAAAVV